WGLSPRAPLPMATIPDHTSRPVVLRCFFRKGAGSREILGLGTDRCARCGLTYVTFCSSSPSSRARRWGAGRGDKPRDYSCARVAGPPTIGCGLLGESAEPVVRRQHRVALLARQLGEPGEDVGARTQPDQARRRRDECLRDELAREVFCWHRIVLRR